MTETKQAPSKRNVFLNTVVVSLLATVLLVTAVLVLSRSRRGPDPGRTQAVKNARQIGLALLEFEQSYGAYPNDSTAKEVTAKTASKLPLGSKNSNAFLRQLLAAEITQNEAIFYAKIPRCSRPDNIIEDIRALEKGECGFSYLIGPTIVSAPETPIVVTPLISGKALFDYKAAKSSFYGQAIILRIDGSVQTHPIDKSGRVWINGKDLFDPTQPFWNGKAPVIKWPDL